MKYFTSSLWVLLCIVAYSSINIQFAVAQVAAPTTGTTTAEVVVAPYVLEELPGTEVYRDFVVGPGKFTLELNPGETKTVELVVSNRMGERKRFSLETEDMTGGSDATEAVKLLGDEKGPYTLKDFISVPATEFELDHAMRARIPVTVSLPADAEPGGRYGSLLVSIVSNATDAINDGGTTSGSVVVSRIGTLFFVTTPGATVQDVSLQSFDTVPPKHFFTKGPISFGIVSENKGSVHATPYGEIRMYNMFGHEVGFVELEPWFVMPASLRLREVSWDNDFLFGRYTAVAKVNRGYDDIVDEQSVIFYVLPLRIVLGAAGTLFVFFFILYFIKTRFEFRRKER